MFLEVDTKGCDFPACAADGFSEFAKVNLILPGYYMHRRDRSEHGASKLDQWLELGHGKFRVKSDMAEFASLMETGGWEP
jgi:hypothetical protein